MKISGTRQFVFAMGVLVGIIGVEGSVHVASAFAHTQGSSTMSQSAPMSKSQGDTEMMATMTAMQIKMNAMHLTGDQDRDFMMMMIPHHRSAMDMARIELRRGKRPEVKALAKNVIASQGGEIEKMTGWLKSWYGGSGAGM